MYEKEKGTVFTVQDNCEKERHKGMKLTVKCSYGKESFIIRRLWFERGLRKLKRTSFPTETNTIPTQTRDTHVGVLSVYSLVRVRL